MASVQPVVFYGDSVWCQYEYNNKKILSGISHHLQGPVPTILVKTALTAAPRAIQNEEIGKSDTWGVPREVGPQQRSRSIEIRPDREWLLTLLVKPNNTTHM